MSSLESELVMNGLPWDLVVKDFWLFLAGCIGTGVVFAVFTPIAIFDWPNRYKGIIIAFFITQFLMVFLYTIFVIVKYYLI
jgi:hypothetical protein